jgi:D-arabinose 1-dehydrogenase-like Zn-dependent alcohol dehydrogenase
MAQSHATAVVLNECNAPVKVESAAVPEPGPGALFARVDLTGVCGTDVHLHHG